jgi:uncharacterized protein
MSEPALLEYPCQYPIKVMGHGAAGFAQAVLEIVARHAPDFDAKTVEMKSSKHGRYLSVTCTITAGSREQLDALYRELCDHPSVVMVL